MIPTEHLLERSERILVNMVYLNRLAIDADGGVAPRRRPASHRGIRKLLDIE
jgi:hypothetical protein